MARFKQIMYFAIIIVVFAVFTDYMIKVGLRNTYKTITGEIKVASPEIVVSESKTTDVNGYVEGTIKNNTEADIEKTFVKLDVYTKRDTNVGTEYLEISNLKVGETREFKIEYRHDDVDHYEITCVNEK